MILCEVAKALVCSFLQGKPKPTVTWTKDGQPLDPKKVSVRSTDKDSILFIRRAERDDSGKYEMCVKVESFEDKVMIVIQIVGECHSPCVVFSAPVASPYISIIFL